MNGALDRIGAAVEAAGAILSNAKVTTIGEKLRPDGQKELVSEYDRLVEGLLIETVEESMPGVPIVSEETREDPAPLDSEWCFVIDPIDGTREFVSGGSAFSISVALLNWRKPVAAWLDFPRRRQRLRAIAGGGAWLNGRRLRVPSPHIDISFRLAVSPNQYADPRFNSFEAGLLGLELVPTPALASKLVGVARGEYDAAVFLGWPDYRAPIWDFAAAGLVLKEAGGRFVSLDGHSILEKMPDVLRHGWLASNGRPFQCAARELNRCK
jgi:myo-inositol-1(or 4)-monophosphatase